MPAVTLVIGTKKGLFLAESPDRKSKWNITGPMMKGWEIYGVTPDPRHGRRLYAAVGSFVYGSTIHVSDDAGRTWRQLENNPRYPEDAGFQVKQIWTVVPGRADEPDVLYAGVDEGGLFISRDSGTSWQEVKSLNHDPSRVEWQAGAGGLCCHTIMPDPKRKERLYAAISAVGLFRSDDGGETWASKNEGIPQPAPSPKYKYIGWCPHKLVFDVADSNCLMRQDHMGVFRSRNAGDSWERIETGLSSGFGFPIAADPRTGSYFVIPLEKDEYRYCPDGALRVYRTRDGGDSWQALTKGLPQTDAFTGALRDAMAVDGLDPCGVYFGTTSGQLYASADGGDSWRQIPGALPRILSVTAVAG